jgi:hypothetical protein
MDEMAALPGVSFGGFRYCCTVVPGLLRFTFRHCDCPTRLQVGPRHRDKRTMVTNLAIDKHWSRYLDVLVLEPGE